jgi:hypothetical protein
MVKGSATLRLAVPRSNVPPDATTVFPADVPKADVLETLKIPAETFVIPVYVLAPERFQVPAPLFVMANEPPPAPSPMIPLTILLPVFVPLRVRVVVLPAVADPVTAPMERRLVADVAPAVKVAVAALVPEI